MAIDTAIVASSDRNPERVIFGRGDDNTNRKCQILMDEFITGLTKESYASKKIQRQQQIQFWTNHGPINLYV